MQDSLIEQGLRWFKLSTFIEGEPYNKGVSLKLLGRKKESDEAFTIAEKLNASQK